MSHTFRPAAWRSLANRRAFGLVAALLSLSLASQRAQAVIVTAGELIVDLKVADLEGGASIWTNRAAGPNSVGDFADADETALNLGSGIGGVDVSIAVDGATTNALLSSGVAPASVLGDETRTVEAWLFSNDVSGSQGVVSWGSRGTNDAMSRFSYNTGGNGKLSAWFNDTGWSDPGSLVSGAWTHVTWTYDGDTTRGYINGTLVSTVDQPSPLATPESVLTLGAAPGASTDPFKGYLADIRVHTGVLTDAQVLNNATEGIGEPDGFACDFDGDGDCDSVDFGTLRDNLFTSGTSAEGDVNRDGFIDLMDYRLFKDDPNRVVGVVGSGPAGAGAGVPEPGCLALLASIGLAAARRGARR